MNLPAHIDEQRWSKMPLMEQMANIGSEIGRTYKWVARDKPAMAEGAYLRALDLIDATVKYGRAGQASRACLLNELLRARDLFTSSYFKKDTVNLAFLDKYFGQFAKAVRK